MSDYNFLMENRLSAPQFEVLNHLARFAHSEGFNLYLVGGAVRDLTYGRQVVRDLDLAVEGNPEKILKHLPVQKRSQHAPRSLLLSESDQPRAQIADFHLSRRLNTADIKFANGVRAELTKCRREVYSRPGKPPEILPATIFDDLKRRDFAMNAMAVSLHPNSRGLLLDPTNGAGDIERQEIRALSSRSFYEDHSRIYRLLRLGARLGFKPDEKTRAWLETAMENRLWTGLLPELQGRELEAILYEDNPGSILKMLADRRLLEGLDRKLKRIPYERFRKLRPLLQKFRDADPLPLNFHCLVSALGAGQRSRLARKIFRLSKTMELALNLERDAKKLARTLASSKYAAPSQAYQLLVNQPETLLIFLLANYPQAKLRARLKNYLLKAPVIRARVPRIELQSLGVRPGPKFEKILSRIFLEQLDGKIRTPQQITKALYAAAGIKEPPPKPAQPERPAARVKKGAKPPQPQPVPLHPDRKKPKPSKAPRRRQKKRR
jgi:tRNA nucleotidyltransferase (CCA-adding enzyme)